MIYSTIHRLKDGTVFLPREEREFPRFLDPDSRRSYADFCKSLLPRLVGVGGLTEAVRVLDPDGTKVQTYCAAEMRLIPITFSISAIEGDVLRFDSDGASRLRIPVEVKESKEPALSGMPFVQVMDAFALERASAMQLRQMGR